MTERRPSLWRHADFMKLWSAETISQFGTQVTLLALPLTAVLVLNATAFQVGVLTAVEYLPFILVGLPAGVWVDRLRRRPILVAGDLLRVVTVGSVPVAYALGILHIPQLYVVAFLTGVGTVFFDVAYQSYLPSLVEREHLVDGNSKLEISRSGAQLAGPGIGGMLVDLLGPAVAIAVDAASYALSALFIGGIRRHETPPRTQPRDSRPKMRHEIGDGVRYVWRHRLLRPIAFCTGSSNLFSAMQMAVLVLFAVRELHMSPQALGLSLALGNVGFLVGAFFAKRIANWVGIGPAIIGSIALTSPATFLLPVATPATAFAFIAIVGFFVGFGGMAIYNINQVSLRQAITPDRMLGRMNATMRFMVWGTMPIGAFAGGVLGNALGLRPTLWISAIGVSLAFLPPLLSPVRTLRRIPDAEPDGHATAGDDLASAHDGGMETPPFPQPKAPRAESEEPAPTA